MDADARRVLEFWFGELDEHGHAPKTHHVRWKGDFDKKMRAAFEPVLRAITAGEREAWLSSPRGRLAYVLVLDQLSRNMFRGTAEEFAHDARALRAALDGIARGDDAKLAPDERLFFYTPLLHSEDLDVQERGVALFRALASSVRAAERARFEEHAREAEAHRDIIQRFGRFPHRNPILDRTSTAEELEFLTEPDTAF